jgi:hypothetical protein
MKTLFLLDPHVDYNQTNINSKLLTSVDDDLLHSTYHTSLGDLTKEQIISIAYKFDQIEMDTTGFDINSDIYKETRILCNYLNKHSTTETPVNFISDQSIYQRPNKPVLWVFGCSHSHGEGLKVGEKKYGEILADRLRLPLKLITKPGSSLHWSARHVINADIRPTDTVVWQLTTPARISMFNGIQTNEVMLAVTGNRSLIDVMSDDQIYFNQISLLNFVIRYLRQIGVRFILTSVLESKMNYQFLLEYSKYPEYCIGPETSIDYGTDGLHAGPLGHQQFAKTILDHIQYRND